MIYVYFIFNNVFFLIVFVGMFNVLVLVVIDFSGVLRSCLIVFILIVWLVIIFWLFNFLFKRFIFNVLYIIYFLLFIIVSKFVFGSFMLIVINV